MNTSNLAVETKQEQSRSQESALKDDGMAKIANLMIVKDRLINEYYGELNAVFGDYLKEWMMVSSSRTMDCAMMALTEEMRFTTIIQGIEEQMDFLKSTWTFIYDLNAISFRSRPLNRAVSALVDNNPEDYETSRTFLRILELTNQFAAARRIQKELLLLKERHIREAYKEITQTIAADSVDRIDVVLQRLDVNMAMIPGTLAYNLLAKHKYLHKMFPEMADGILSHRLTNYMCDFLAYSDSYRMNDFKLKIIRYTEDALAQIQSDEISQEDLEKLRADIESAKSEEF